MLRICLLLAGLVALWSVASAQSCGNLCPEFFSYCNGTCYRMSAGRISAPGRLPTRLEGLPFRRANQYCKTLHPDAHLVVINDAVELENLFEWVPSLEPYEVWIGLFYNITAMQWQWVNGDPLTFTHWEPFYGEPQVLNGGAAVMFLSEVFTPQTTRKYGYGLEVSDYWISIEAAEELPFICEYTPPSLVATEAPTTNTTGNYSTSMPPITGTFGPATMAPQVLFQQEARPMRLSDYFGFGGLRERKMDQTRRGSARSRGAPSSYRRRGGYAEISRRNNGYQYPVMP